MITFIHSVIAAVILSVALIWFGAILIEDIDDIEYGHLEPWYKRLWAFLVDWKENYSLYLILASCILILYWVMEGILRIL